ncbi:hypothetical protein LSH36_835g00037 [Paralvinella palmiformis]|uniref:Phorbol-ester/DAG-type domain-containing protein n=1 Tax=Paralvinella palmiformis TaxID=53620 RepID=A0AAD9IZC2_9ANNE|nr:hypothetical protein LSH36_835g00037 [Paralvinella palmiformis]
MAASLPASRTGKKRHVLETATATVQFTGCLQQGDDTESDSSSSCGIVHDHEPVITKHSRQDDISTDINQPSNSRVGVIAGLNKIHDTSHSAEDIGVMDANTDDGAGPCFHGDKQSDRTIEDNQEGEFIRPVRFNPFNREDFEEEDDQFPDDMVSNSNCSRSIQSCEDSLDNPELHIKEDYFAQPEDHISLMSIEDLVKAITECKEQVVLAPSGGDKKKNLTHQLIQLRLQLAEAKERTTQEEEGVRSVTGHLFMMKVNQRSRRYCEQCNTAIWGVVQTWYRCKNCGFCCHEKCLDLVRRTCAHVKVQENPEYILTICPEKTLASQNYKCAECRSDISFHASQYEPRLCDYSGCWYCSQCHWNDHTIIPARVLHNWDFETKKVCRASKQFLKLMQKRAVLRVLDINPMLFNFVDELSDVKKLREEILIMKQYFLRCKGALKSKLLLQLKNRQHFVDNSDMYSLIDLQDIANDVLLPELVKIHASFAQHIKTDCPFCQTKGSLCALCDERELLFPFDGITIVCSVCSAVLHSHGDDDDGGDDDDDKTRSGLLGRDLDWDTDPSACRYHPPFDVIRRIAITTYCHCDCVYDLNVMLKTHSSRHTRLGLGWDKSNWDRSILESKYRRLDTILDFPPPHPEPNLPPPHPEIDLPPPHPEPDFPPPHPEPKWE